MVWQFERGEVAPVGKRFNVAGGAGWQYTFRIQARETQTEEAKFIDLYLSRQFAGSLWLPIILVVDAEKRYVCESMVNGRPQSHTNSLALQGAYYWVQAELKTNWWSLVQALER